MTQKVTQFPKPKKMYSSTNKFWFTIWKEVEKQLLTEKENNARKKYFRSKEQQESVSNTSEALTKCYKNEKW